MKAASVIGGMKLSGFQASNRLYHVSYPDVVSVARVTRYAVKGLMERLCETDFLVGEFRQKQTEK